MVVSDHVLLTGGDLEEGGSSIVDGWGDDLAWGFSPGCLPPGSMKVDPNEDGLCAVVRSRCRVVAVADAHYGRSTSEAALRAIYRTARAPGAEGLDAGDLLFAAFQEVRDLVSWDREPEEEIGTSASAVMVARVEGLRVRFAWVGDCRAYRIGATGAGPVSEPEPNWLEPRRAALGVCEFEARSMILPWYESSLLLEEGEILLLCTDGLTEPIYGVPVLDSSDFIRLVPLEAPLLESSRALLDEALRTDRVYGETEGRGAEDNVAFVLVRVGSP